MVDVIFFFFFIPFKVAQAAFKGIKWSGRVLQSQTRQSDFEMMASRVVSGDVEAGANSHTVQS